MVDSREHTVILKKSPSETIIEAKCGKCGWIMADPSEYHPPAFCILVEARENPFELVRAASSRLPKPGVIQLQEVHDARK